MTPVVVIPFYMETKPLVPIISLFEAKYDGIVDVVCVFNAMADNITAIEVNNKSLHKLESIRQEISHKIKLHLLVKHNLNKKTSGVGNARRIGMDYAEKLYDDEILLFAFDADSEVSPNYFNKVINVFNKNNKLDLLNLNYEHRLGLCSNQTEKDAIIHYELYLRTYTNAWKLVNYPYAFTTIGSSFVVKGSAYVKFGRMNRKKAGEDFYFIHKVAQNGKVMSDSEVLVFPSPRLSHRVPFGTGHFITNFVGKTNEYLYPKLNVFLEIKPIFDKLKFVKNEKDLYEIFAGLSTNINQFLTDNNFTKSLDESIKQTSNIYMAAKRIAKWFTGLRMIQFLHFVEKKGENIVLEELATEVIAMMYKQNKPPIIRKPKIKLSQNLTKYTLLKIIREIDSQKS